MARKPVKNAPTEHGADNSLMRLVLRGTAIGLLTAIASFLYLLMIDEPRRAEARMIAASTEVANAQAELVDQLIGRWQFRILSVTKDPSLIAAAAEGSSPLPHLERQLQRAFPETISSRLIPLGPLGIASLRTETAGLRNNIEIDMLRRASGGKTVPPESYNTEQGQVVSFAQPIVAPDADHAAAVVLVSLPAGQLGHWLNTVGGERGQTRLVQQIGDQAQTVVTVGKGDRTNLTQVANLNVPNWQLQFTPASSWLAAIGPNQLPLWLALAATSAGILLGCLLIATDLRRALQRNLDGLSGNGSLDLPGFATTRQQLLRKMVAPPVLPPEPQPAPLPEPAPEPAAAPTAPEPALSEERLPDEPLPLLAAAIFRAYDIRGNADTQLSDGVVRQLALAIGSEAVDRGQQQILVARDGRHSSSRIAQALVRGLQEAGRDVIDLGLVPTPVLYFATHELGIPSGVVVTGSHNPAADNGLKIVLSGRALSGQAIQRLRERIEQRQFTSGRGSYRTESVTDRYVDYIVNDVAIAQPLKIVVDAGNGAASEIAPRLFEALGCEVLPLFCEIDGSFPNHHPDPTVAANLRDLQRVVTEEGADLGLAFDGDGDRIGVVTGSGGIVEADRLLMLLAQDVVARNPGADVVFDVKCSRALATVISSFGGRPIMWKSGHSFMKEKMAETGALVGGEFSGHIFFNERWFGFDDGLYAGARLIEILSTSDPDLDRQLEAFPALVSTPEIKVPTSDDGKFDLVARLAAEGHFQGGRLTTLDGVRVDFPDGWGLARASNTTPALVLRFEAEDEAALRRVQMLFRDQLQAIDPSLEFGF